MDALGIAVEIPQPDFRRSEELKRIARPLRVTPRKKRKAIPYE